MMSSNKGVGAAVRLALGVTTSLVLVGAAPSALAQDDVNIEEITVTGTRVTVPGVVSSSPVYSVGSEEIDTQQQPSVERILRLLPITKPDDGQNVNNGTAGVATVDLRGLGSQRNLVLIDGKRATPYDIDGIVDTSIIPTALVERIDIITGGASAVYGSDAIAGALNFVMKNDFEGVDIRGYHTETSKGDGQTQSMHFTVGANMDGGRGNAVLSLNWTEREAVLFGQRPLGQLGIGTASGSNYDNFLNGDVPTPPSDPLCQGPGAVSAGGSTTTIPTRVGIAGGSGLGQFRDDRTLGSNCSVFNFNPVNLYQTPQERFGGMMLGHYEVNEHLDFYARAGFSATNVTQQVAPSGIFGFTFFTPMANPFISTQARGVMLAQAEADRVAGLVNVAGTPDPSSPGDFLFHNWNDLNGNNIVDAADDLRISYRRRTVEFGNRSSIYDQNHFQFVIGSRGEIMNDWTYDVSFQRGETDRTDTSQGYTNVDAIESSIRTLDGVTCQNGDPACVPLDVFGGFGTITPAMAAANSATAIETRNYKQTIGTVSFSGPIEAIKLPTADEPIAVSIGAEYRDEVGKTTPDECWKLQPSSCLGGAGGFRSPVQGAYNVMEFFGEAFLPIVSGRTLFQELNLELGIRTSDYDISGRNETWKVGFNWRPVDSLLVRVMQQEAIRAPNVGEIGSPNTTGLEDALIDPCSVVNAGNIDATLQALCLSTGMSLPQVGAVEDIVSGQINSIEGTDFGNLPRPETAETFTAGFVWTPEFDFVDNLVLSVDYYDIQVDDIIGEFSAQEVLDGCYTFGVVSQCEKIRRVGGTLTLPGSGTELFTTNLVFQKAEGLEIGASFGVNLGNYGDLQVSANINHYLTAESQPADFLPVLDCLGKYGNSCENPSPETAWIQRTSWNFMEDFTVSYLWRHIGSTDIESAQVDGTFPEFRSIDDYNYVDLSGFWQVTDQIQVSVAINNVFGEDPPVVGNEAGSTSSNSGNTFPSAYDTLGTIYTAGFNFRF